MIVQQHRVGGRVCEDHVESCLLGWSKKGCVGNTHKLVQLCVEEWACDLVDRSDNAHLAILECKPNVIVGCGK